MNYLIDTHILLWTLFEPEKLSKRIKKEIQNPENQIFVSSITFWEISLKYSLGKLKLENINPENLIDSTKEAGLEIIELDVNDMATFHYLPKTEHKDPFDRILIWQCIRKNYILISHDSSLKLYEPLGLRYIH